MIAFAKKRFSLTKIHLKLAVQFSRLIQANPRVCSEDSRPSGQVLNDLDESAVPTCCFGAIPVLKLRDQIVTWSLNFLNQVP